jgi:hypothetical protein
MTICFQFRIIWDLPQSKCYSYQLSANGISIQAIARTSQLLLPAIIIYDILAEDHVPGERG